MKKLMVVTAMVAGALSLFAETDEIGKAVSKTSPANQWCQTWMPPELASGMKLLFR